MTVRFYSSLAAETSLTNSITNASTSADLGSTTGLPSSFPFTLAFDYEGTSEELTQVTAMAGTTVTITRAFNGTSATSHGAGARVRHVSCAQDFTDSRTHENSSMGVHGLAAGSSVVGTMETQTLENKTLDLATGTLSDIEIFNTPGPWTTTVTGDGAFPAADILSAKPSSVLPTVFAVANTGNLVLTSRDAAVDAATNGYRVRITRTNGSTDVASIRAGGQFLTKIADGAGSGSQGFTSVAPTDNSDVPAFTGMDPSNTTRRFIAWSDGRVDINGTNPVNSQLDVLAAPAQTASIQRWQSSGGATTHGQVLASGELSWGTSGISTSGGILSTGSITANGGITIQGEPVTAGAWNIFTPVWTASGTPPSLGNGIISGRFAVVGRTYTVHINLTPGSTTTFGTGVYSFSLPVPAANNGSSMIGNAELLGSARWAGQTVVSPTAVAFSPFFSISSGDTRLQAMTPTAPETFANGSSLRMTFVYESAT